MKKKLLLSLFSCLFFGTGFTQTKIIGIAEVPCPTISALGLSQQDICKKPTWCMTKLGVASNWAGAATWDEVLNAAWVSNGPAYAVVYPNVCQKPCLCKCKTLCFSFWPIKNHITGMAIDSFRRVLFISDSNGYIHLCYITKKICPLKIGPSCRFPVRSRGERVTGLAYDKVHKYLFVLTVNFYTSIKTTTIYVTKASSPCKPFCSWKIYKPCQNANFEGGLGITYDPCSMNIFVSDMKGTTLIVKWDGHCGFKPVKCCPAEPVKKNLGLGLRRSICDANFYVFGSNSYASHPCPNQKCHKCNVVPYYSGGYPVLGNPFFALELSNVPNPKGFFHFGFVIFNFYNHCKKQVFPLPCGPVYLYPYLDPGFFVFGASIHSGIGSQYCGLKGHFPAPIPAVPEFCCAKVCGQWLIFNVGVGIHNQWCLTLSKGFGLKIGG